MAKDKFIPNGDPEFVGMARVFAAQLARDPQRFESPPGEAEAIAAALQRLNQTMAANFNGYHRSRATAARKSEARAALVQLIRDAAHRIRINRRISAADKLLLGIRTRGRPRRQKCPQTAPQLLLGGTAARTFGTPGIHLIRFWDPTVSGTTAKPEGATRLELFVDLIPPGDPIPAFPGQLSGGRNWYLGSYTRSPIRLAYPQSPTPMQIVYWGRWANATGETGPFSLTLVAPIEGLDWSRFTLPAPPAPPSAPSSADDDRALPGRVGQTVIVTSARRELPEPAPPRAAGASEAPRAELDAA